MMFPGGKIPDGASPEAIYMKRLERIAREVARPSDIAGFKSSRTTQGSFIVPEDSGGPASGQSSGIKSFRLFDVQDDYLICVAPPIAPSGGFGTPRFIGSFVEADFDGATIVINPLTTPTVTYSPVKNDMIWRADTDQRKWQIFDGTAWDDMVSPGSTVYDSTKAARSYVAKEYLHRTSLVGLTIFDNSHKWNYTNGPREQWAAQTANRFNKTRNDFDGEVTRLQRIVPPWTEGEPILAVPCDRTGAMRPVLKDDGSPLLDDHGKPVLSPVRLHIVGRSAQWAQLPN